MNPIAGPNRRGRRSRRGRDRRAPANRILVWCAAGLLAGAEVVGFAAVARGVHFDQASTLIVSSGSPHNRASRDQAVGATRRVSSTAFAPAVAAAMQEDQEGAAIFAENCAACHGPNGEGGIGPALTGASLPPDEIATVIEAGRDGMPAFSGVLDAAQIEATVHYIAALRAAPAPTTTVPETPQPTATGAALFVQWCVSCHGPNGEGGRGAVGPSLQAGDKSYAEIVEIVTKGRSLMPVFGRVLDQTEITEVAAVAKTLQTDAPTIATLPASADPPVIFAFECAACHGADGEGGFGPRLAGTSLSVEQIAAVIEGGSTMGPMFRDRLDETQIAAVATYVSGLEVPPEAAVEEPESADQIGVIIYLSIVVLTAFKLLIDYRRLVGRRSVRSRRSN